MPMRRSAQSMHLSKISESISNKISLMKYIGGVSVGMWILFAVITMIVWGKSYEAGFDKCTAQTAQASDMDVQKLIADLAAGMI